MGEGTDGAAGESFLLTGALGCIGAWTVRTLVRSGAEVTVLDLASDPHRLRLILTPDELAQVRFLVGDITDLATVEAALEVSRARQLIHLAALQVPFCRADPPLGARVNVLGTVNIFEAARRAGLAHVVYASSVAVYGSNEDYGDEINAGMVDDATALRPRTLYGVFKQANEGTARVYWLENGLSSIGLRPHTVYGPGRDQGMTSGPTVAMLAAAAGFPYTVAFGGRFGMQYARDVAETFVAAALAPHEGADVFNLRGAVVEMREVIDAIEAAAPASRGQIRYDDIALPVPSGQADTGLAALLGRVPNTPLAEGVAESITIFKQALAQGLIALPTA
jgi:nucleoside-diphosphate-sugar epimerase